MITINLVVYLLCRDLVQQHVALVCWLVFSVNALYSSLLPGLLIVAFCLELVLLFLCSLCYVVAKDFVIDLELLSLINYP